MILIKLGGSVITDKTQYRMFDRECASRLCRELADSGKRAVIVHGVGSFGHVVAKAHSLQDGFSGLPGQAFAAATVQHDVRDLNSMVVKELLSAGVLAFPVPPGSCFMMDGGVLDVKDAEVLTSAFRLGMTPVLFGDVVLDRRKGFGICSGDQIMEALCDVFDPEKVVFVSDIDGLYDMDPKKHAAAKLIEEVTAESLERVDSKMSVDDVTGGVRGKMEAMLRISTPERECVLVNGAVPGRLRSLLKGERVISTTATGGTG
ncbi:MAG: isopentenyl phosphate kinase family protein [Candidatus Methanoplasma sp.]|nr:isopentenyl phosphate kinase family protein [Candidatus Methanoplasma sp.]